MRALPDAGSLTLRATVTDVATGRQVGAGRRCARDSDDVHTPRSRRCPPATTGSASRGSATSAGLADPVHGLVCVVDDAAPDVDPGVD